MNDSLEVMLVFGSYMGHWQQQQLNYNVIKQVDTSHARIK